MTLDQAVDKAVNNNIDLRILRLASDSAYYTTRLTLFDTNAMKIDSISSLKSAKAKYEIAAVKPCDEIFFGSRNTYFPFAWSMLERECSDKTYIGSAHGRAESEG